MGPTAVWTAISVIGLCATMGVGQGLASEPPEQPRARAAPADEPPMPLKEYDCGGKGQSPCPMQGWMKTVMAAAASSGEGEKIASALSYVAARPPPGMSEWASIASAGAEKAKAGDVEASKASCKTCHDLYKATYKETMRDRPF